MELPFHRRSEKTYVISMSEDRGQSPLNVIQFREKLVDVIKSLLSGRMINYSRSPCASPVVVTIKKDGVDMRLCIDYRLVNILTQLMIYAMLLINDLLQDLEATLWYCSLDMASGFWVVKRTDRAHFDLGFCHSFWII
ncbi:reverse transcriptase [Phytophthora megakarya]|uniref:Reverse transcriptase n=1 Tax=Phytophthora megakarya TaxID=4795 RepID=A0A225WLH7_9STRA|nr:reverse transcriptase [Phytophthora megakarya]